MERSIEHSSTEPPPLHDPGYVRLEYADDAGLAGRMALWAACPDPQPAAIALEQVLALQPARVLEVGCGRGEFAAALAEHGLDVTALDQSERMVRLTAVRFGSENGQAVLEPHFAHVVRIDVSQRFTVTTSAARDYVRASRFADRADRVPQRRDGIEVTASGTVFLATTGPRMSSAE